MEKNRPPLLPEDSKSERNLIGLSRYPERMLRKYLRTEPNGYPRHLYKYISDTKSNEQLRCLLIDSDFYLSSSKDFNDPFDTTAQIIQEGTVLQRRKKLKQVVLENAPKLKKQQLENKVSELMRNHGNGVEAVKKAFYQNTQKIGIFSLTRNPRNILMWSHYANHHKGIILQFNISKDVESLLHVLPMHYSQEYPKFGLLSDFEDHFKEIMLRKSEDWEYEDEWRILRVGGAHTFQAFKPKALSGIIFGCRATEDYKSQIKDLLAERNSIHKVTLNLYQAVMHPTKYALEIKKLSHL